jgi:ankyrin repeat protein
MAILELIFNIHKDIDINKIDDYNNTILHHAIAVNNIDAVEFLLARGADINSAARETLSALEFACQYGNTKTLNLIFDKYQDIDIDKLNDFGNTLLFHAICGNNIEAIQFLLDKKADIHAAEQGTLSSLELACKYGSAKILKLIFEGRQKIDINKLNEYGNTILCYAIYGNNIETIQFLLEKEADIHAAKDAMPSALECACKYGNAKILKLIFDKYKDLDLNKTNNSGKTLFCYAIDSNNFETTNFLLKNGVNVSTTIQGKLSSLEYAFKYANEPILELIFGKHKELNNGLNKKDYYGKTLLDYAIETKNAEAVNFLLKNGADINSTKQCILFALDYICEYGNEEILKLILDKYKELDLNKPNNSGKTLLDYALRENNIETAEFLLENGADICSAKNGKVFAISYLCNNGKIKILKLIFDRYKELGINTVDDLGNNMLYYAICVNNVEAVRLLIDNENKDDISTAEQDKLSILELACQYGNAEILKLIYDRHEDLNKNKLGKTLLCCTCEKNNTETVRFLTDKKACHDSSTNDKSTQPESLFTSEEEIDESSLIRVNFEENNPSEIELNDNYKG